MNKIVVTAGDVREEAKILYQGAFFFGLIGFFSNTWYIKYPSYAVAIFIIYVSVRLMFAASDAAQNVIKDSQ